MRILKHIPGALEMDGQLPTYFFARSLMKISQCPEHEINTIRAVVRTGATGAIAPVDFGREAQVAPIDHDSILVLAPVD